MESIAVHDEEATAVKSNWRFMEIDGDEYLSPSSLSLSLCQVWTHTLTELHEIHPQLYSILLTTAREFFSSLGSVSVGSASLLSVQPLLPWWGEASSVEVLSTPI